MMVASQAEGRGFDPRRPLQKPHSHREWFDPRPPLCNQHSHRERFEARRHLDPLHRLAHRTRAYRVVGFRLADHIPEVGGEAFVTAFRAKRWLDGPKLRLLVRSRQH